MGRTKLILIFLLLGTFSAWAQEEEEMSVEEFLQRLSSVRKVLERRDPFQENTPSFIKVDEAQIEKPLEDLPPLERHPVERYTVKAILLGDKSPRALIKIPEGGTAIVEQNSKLGDKSGVISKIDRHGIEISERIKNNFGSYDNIVQKLPVGVVKETSGGNKR